MKNLTFFGLFVFIISAKGSFISQTGKDLNQLNPKELIYIGDLSDSSDSDAMGLYSYDSSTSDNEEFDFIEGEIFPTESYNHKAKDFDLTDSSDSDSDSDLSFVNLVRSIKALWRN